MSGLKIEATRTLRILVIANLVVLVLLATNIEYPPLPEELQAYRDPFLKGDLDAYEIAFLGLAAPTVIAYNVSLIGILFNWRRSRQLLLLVMLAGIPLEILVGPEVYSTFSNTLNAASYALSGIILGALYFPALTLINSQLTPEESDSTKREQEEFGADPEDG